MPPGAAKAEHPRTTIRPRGTFGGLPGGSLRAMTVNHDQRVGARTAATPQTIRGGGAGRLAARRIDRTRTVLRSGRQGLTQCESHAAGRRRLISSATVPGHARPIGCSGRRAPGSRSLGGAWRAADPRRPHDPRWLPARRSPPHRAPGRVHRCGDRGRRRGADHWNAAAARRAGSPPAVDAWHRGGPRAMVGCRGSHGLDGLRAARWHANPAGPGWPYRAEPAPAVHRRRHDARRSGRRSVGRHAGHL